MRSYLRSLCFLIPLCFYVVSCTAPALQAPVSSLSSAQKQAIGKKIWKNECAGTLAGLTTWNSGENFPSLGIGHFIWYPKNYQGPFDESWPSFIQFAKAKGANPPAIAQHSDAPWSSRSEFQASQQSSSMKELRAWLAATIGLQTDFIIIRSQQALGKMLSAAPSSERNKIATHYHLLTLTPQGMYALIDYVNFKGEGIKTSERYNGYGWGLMQVLGNMSPTHSSKDAPQAFSESAKKVLSRRVQNSPPNRGEAKWLKGWHQRCNTYAQSF